MNELEKNEPENPLGIPTSPTNVDTSSSGRVDGTVAEVKGSIENALPRNDRPVLAKPKNPPTYSGSTGMKTF